MMQSFGQVLAYIKGQGTNYTTYTASKSLLNSATTVAGVASGLILLPPGFLREGSILTIDAMLGISSVSGNTMTWEVRLGPTANIVVNGTMTNKVTTTTSITVSCALHLEGVVRAEGSGTLANMLWTGFIIGRNMVPNGATPGADYTAGSGIAMLPDGNPAVGTGFDSTVANLLDLWCAMGTSAAGNGVQLQQYRVTSHNLAGA